MARRSTGKVLFVLALAAAACGRQAFAPSGLGTSTPTASPSPTFGGGLVLDTSARVTATLTQAVSIPSLHVGTGSDGCLVASLALSGRSFASVALVWGTGGVIQALTPVTSQTNGAGGTIFLQALVGPKAARGALSASWTGAANAVLGAFAFSGADPTGCAAVSSASLGSGTSGNPSLVSNSAVGHASVAAAMSGSAFLAKGAAQPWAGALVSSSAAGPVRLLQANDHDAQNVTSDEVGLGSAPAQGDTLVFVGANDGGTLTSVSGGGVTWVKAAGSPIESNMEIWYGFDASGKGPASITYTTSVAGNAFAWAGELSNLLSLGAAAAAGGTGGTGGGPCNPGTIATTGGQVAFVGCSSISGTSISPPTNGPWQNLSNVLAIFSGNSHVFQVNNRTLAPGTPTIDPTSTLTNSTGWASAVAVFNPRTVVTSGLGSAGSLLAGSASPVTHQWTTTTSGAWAAVGADVVPAH